MPAARSVRERSYAHEKPPLSKRALEDLALTRQIHEIHRRSHGCYGAPRIHAELLQEHGVRLGRKRMARLMRAAGLRGVSRRRFVRTTTPEVSAGPPVAAARTIRRLKLLSAVAER